MKASLNWLNSLVRPGDLTLAEAEELLTFAGFPIESKEAVAVSTGVDHWLDVEVTSNRGDCLSHTGLAREIVAASGGRRALNLSGGLGAPGATGVGGAPNAAGSGNEVAQAATLCNEIAALCPRFALRVIKGCRVGPSPQWLVDALGAIGQRSINNVVDATNYVLHELGSPSHVFDLAKIARGPEGRPLVVVREARAGEKLALLDGQTAELRAGDMVVCDAQGPVSLAGIMGGQPTSVSNATTDVLLEVATWDPVRVRTTARRLNLRTDSSHRFERIVDARSIDGALARLTALIEQLSGGRALGGTLDDTGGVALAGLDVVSLRPSRCRALLGWDVPTDRMVASLASLGLEPSAASGDPDATITCRVPAWRTDLRVEVDLIEEVARTIGYGAIPQPEAMQVRVSGLQASQQALRELARVLTGAGFSEAVTFSFVSAASAKGFVGPGLRTLSVLHTQRAGDGVLRPSILPSLLACRRLNQDAKSDSDRGVRLFELSSVFGEVADEALANAAAGNAAGANAHDAPVGTRQPRRLALLLDAHASLGASAHERQQQALRLTRGVIDELVFTLRGPGARVDVDAASPALSTLDALDAHARAAVRIDGTPVGWFGLVAAKTQKQFDLVTPVVACELDVAALIDAYPVARRVRALPQFPMIQRDLSLVLDEGVPWSRVEGVLGSARPPELRATQFVGVYRGKPLPEGKKSVTFRMEFRHDQRTLRDEEINAQVDGLVGAFGRELGATLRT